MNRKLGYILFIQLIIHTLCIKSLEIAHGVDQLEVYSGKPRHDDIPEKTHDPHLPIEAVAPITGSTLSMSSSRVVIGENPIVSNSRDNWVLAQKLDKKYSPLDISFKRKYHKR